MSFRPSYDPSMMPSPARGKASTRFSSPRHPYNSPGNERQQSPFHNRGFRTPNRHSRGRGRGCQYGDYQRDVQQFSPNYRSMNGSYQGSSPNCSFDRNLKRRIHSGRGLYHPSMLSDPWEGLSTDGKPMFRAANYISESFMSYCAKLQSKSSNKTAGDETNNTLDSSSVSQLAANVSKLYESFVSNSSQNIPGNKADDRAVKVSKTELSSDSNVESSSEALQTKVGLVEEKEEVKSDVKDDESNIKDDESDDSDDGNIMF
ncbi:hypothetical protein ACHWQZ_G018987 [Mnemiopsis leidyi]